MTISDIVFILAILRLFNEPEMMGELYSELDTKTSYIDKSNQCIDGLQNVKMWYGNTFESMLFLIKDFKHKNTNL